MALPNIVTPEFITQIPSTGQEINYRPFLVKEEKILLMALEGQDSKEIQNAVLKILSNCISTDIDVNKLSVFDIEYLFLQLRGKSVGEVIELKVGHEQADCNYKTDVKLKIDDIKVVGEKLDPKIMLTDDVGVVLRYPNLNDFTKSMISEDSESLFNVINSCIEYVFDTDEVYNDFSPKEISEWVNSLNQTQFQKIVDFFQSSPKLEHDVTWTCEKCGETETIKLEGLQSFFT